MAKKLKKLVFIEGRWGSLHSRFVELRAGRFLASGPSGPSDGGARPAFLHLDTLYTQQLITNRQRPV